MSKRIIEQVRIRPGSLRTVHSRLITLFMVPAHVDARSVMQDANNLRGSYGPADYDVRHSFNANYVWEVPVKEALRGHGPNYLVRGWRLSGTIFAQTGFDYTCLTGPMRAIC